MNKKDMILSASAAMTVLAMALPAAALSVQQVTSGAIDASASSSLGQRVGDVVKTIKGVGASTSVNADVNASNSDDGSANAGLDVNADVNASGTGAPVMVSRADVDGNTVTAASADASTVLSDTDMPGFIAAQIKGDANLQSAQSTQDSVAVTYKVPAKLLGFIPMTVDATAVVNADGSVTVDYPWYSFLLATNGNLNARVQNAVSGDLGASGDLSGTVVATSTGNAMQSGNASATGTANAQAHAQANTHASAQALANAATRAKLIADIRAAMAAEVNASASGSANVNQ